MASYVSDCKNIFIASGGDSGVNNNYNPYSTANDACNNCLTNDNYYVNSFSNYGSGGSCGSAPSNQDGAGYVSDGVNWWMEGTAQQNTENGTNAGSGNPDYFSAQSACNNGKTWPLLLGSGLYTLYGPCTNEGFQVVQTKKSSNKMYIILIILFVLIAIGCFVYYRNRS